MSGGGADVDRGRRAGVLLAVDDADIAKILLGGGIPDQDADVDVGLERRGVEDARDVEPLAAQPDPLIGVHAVDAELLRGDCADHGDR